MVENYPPVAHIYEENGNVVLGINEEWWNQTKEEYLGFDSFKYYFRKRNKEDCLLNFDAEDGMNGLIKNAPDEWMLDDKNTDFSIRSSLELSVYLYRIRY